MDQSEPPIVTTRNGKLRGTTGVNIDGETFIKFLGIQYGKPPVGDLRFRPPQPTEPWDGVMDAIHVGNSAVSRDDLNFQVTGSENCLFLNVYCKKIPTSNFALKPVMVYIHGGGFMVGSSSPEMCGPEHLLTKDIILVTLNYRLGILGFLSVDGTDITGNMGLKDQNLALKWVRDNIESFGGDSKNVTIFGESAGSSSVHAHILSPASKGLFHKAILQSGSCFNFWVYGSKNNATAIVEKLGKKASSEKDAVDILMQTDAFDILAAQEKFSDMESASQSRPFGVTIESPSDTAFLWEDPRKTIEKGTYNKVPMIVGYNDMEGLLSYLIDVLQGRTEPNFQMETSIPYDFGLLPGTPENAEAVKILKQAYTSNNKHPYEELTDSWFLAGISEAVVKHVKTNTNPIYFYRMSIVTKLNHYRQRMEALGKPPPWASGAAHGDDLGYILHTALTPKIDPGSIEDKYLRIFIELWTNFAKLGDPTPDYCKLGVRWQPLEQNKKLIVLDIGEPLQVIEAPEHKRIDAWLNVVEKATRER